MATAGARCVRRRCVSDRGGASPVRRLRRDQYRVPHRPVHPRREHGLTVFAGATYLVHRTAESQILGPNSSLRVYRSTDHGSTWSAPAIIAAPSDRDLHDPSFDVDATGALSLKAITRLPVNSTRDSDVDSITVRTAFVDGAWTPLAPIGPAMGASGASTPIPTAPSTRPRTPMATPASNCSRRSMASRGPPAR